MLDACSARFADHVAAGQVEVRHHDLRGGYPDDVKPATAVLLILTLQFVPIEYRQRVLRDVYRSLSPNGVLVLVEKVLGASAEIDAFMVDTYYGLKHDNGYSQDAIERKRLSLEGVLVPLTASFNERLMEGAGFDEIDCCWAWANFRAWIALKN